MAKKIPTNHNSFLFREEKFAKLRKLAPQKKTTAAHAEEKNTELSFFALWAGKARGCENKNHARNWGGSVHGEKSTAFGRRCCCASQELCKLSFMVVVHCSPFFVVRFHLGINPLRRVMHLVYWLIVLTGRSVLRRFLIQCMLTFACQTLNSISLMPGWGKSYKVARPVIEIGMNQ